VTSEVLVYTVSGMSCGHCKAAVEDEVSAVAGVELVVADFVSKRVEVKGVRLDDGAIRAAIENAGYEAA
jgi:copper chaperone